VFEFLTRPGCHLCDQARPLVEFELGRRKLGLIKVDIDTDRVLVEDYGSRIPVLLDPDGVVIVEGRIEPRSLRRAMRRWRPRV